MQVKGAISAIRYTEHFPQLPDNFEISGQRDADMFDLLEYVFGFQVCTCFYLCSCFEGEICTTVHLHSLF